VKNSQKLKLKATDILGRKILIIGESGSGKTKLVARLFKELTLLIRPERITVVDLAPRRVGGIGGKILDYAEVSSKVKYLSPEIVYTPRLAGESREQVLHLARLNKKNMEPLLNQFIQSPTEALIVNDITLYLHLGRLEKVLDCVKLAHTFLATAYYGSKLANDFGAGISLNEERQTDRLATLMDSTVKIDH
jgi:energy-coupling factor transporter ATP-binding protein EcfA2